MNRSRASLSVPAHQADTGLRRLPTTHLRLWQTLCGLARPARSRIVRSRGCWAVRVLLICIQLACPLSGALAGSAGVASDPDPGKTANWVTWHMDNFFAQCGGNCAVSIFGGPQLVTHQYNIFIHGTPPWDWQLGNADLVGGAISRRLLTLWSSLDIEPEFGLAKRLGSMHADEAWLVLNIRWTRFPWNRYLRTSIAITFGPSVAVDLPSGTPKDAVILNYFSPEITFALPQYPQYEMMVQLHHRSDIVDIGSGGTPDRGWQFLTVGLRYHF
jgi:hypothetical protein